jgi:far upstream element-binding protein
VKAINQQTGAFVEISRQLPPNGDPNFKLFIIRGSPQQIDHAKQLIEEKIEVGSRRVSVILGPCSPLPSLPHVLLPPGSPLPSWTRPGGTRPCWSYGTLQPRTLQPGATRGSPTVSTVQLLGVGVWVSM